MTILAAFNLNRPRYRGMVKGRRVYDFPVKIEFTKPYGTLDEMIYPLISTTEVISTDAASAANWAMENIAMPMVSTLDYMGATVRVVGIKGGITERHAGPESIVMHTMLNSPATSGWLF